MGRSDLAAATVIGQLLHSQNEKYISVTDLLSTGLSVVLATWPIHYIGIDITTISS